MMQQMPELVEDSLHFAVGKKRRLAFDRRRQIAADQTQVRFESLRRKMAREKRIHPRPAPLVLARIPVRIERAQCRSVRVENRIILRLRIPNRHAVLLYYLDSVEASDNLV